jgi:hypothetical protein
MPANPSGASTRNQPNVSSGTGTGPDSIKYLVRAPQMKQVGPFPQGKTPTLLDAVEAKKVADFIENLIWRTVGELRTGSPPEKRFTMDYTPAGNELTLWVPTDLFWDKSPQLGANLDFNSYEAFHLEPILFRCPAFHVYNGGEIRLSTKGQFNHLIDYSGFRSAGGATGRLVWTLPTADGSSGQFLKTDGSANLSWGSGGGGGMDDFIVAADSGPNQTITDGNTLSILGTSGKISCVASATDTVTVDWIDSDLYLKFLSFVATGTGVVSGDANVYVYENALGFDIGDGLKAVGADSSHKVTLSINSEPCTLVSLIDDGGGTVAGDTSVSIYENTLTLDAGSNITLTGADLTGEVKIAASGGGSGMTSFDAAADSGSAQTITNGNTLTIAGGTALASVASATDTITVNHDNSGVSAATYGSATQVGQFAVNAQGHITSASNVTISGGSGTVTSVATANGTFVNVTGGTITTSGTITGDLSATGTKDNTTFLRGDNVWAVPSGGGGAGTFYWTDRDGFSGDVAITTETFTVWSNYNTHSDSQVDGDNYIVATGEAGNARRLNIQIGRNVGSVFNTGIVDGSTGSTSGDSADLLFGTAGPLDDPSGDGQGPGAFRIEAGDEINIDGNALDGIIAISLNPAGIDNSGTYGAGAQIPVVEVDAFGRIVSISQTSKTAIVKSSDPDPDAYIDLYCTESPEVRFEDVLVIEPPSECMKFTKELDSEFVFVCEPDSIKAIGHTTSEPAIVGLKVNGGNLEVEFSELLPVPSELVVHLSGIRKGNAGTRFTKKTKKQADLNTSFWQQAHQPV